MFALVKLKEGNEKFPKFMEWMQPDKGLAERSKFAIPSKTIGTVMPDKSEATFKVFVTYKGGMMDYVSGKNPVMKHTYDKCIESGQLWGLSAVGL